VFYTHNYGGSLCFFIKTLFHSLHLACTDLIISVLHDQVTSCLHEVPNPFVFVLSSCPSSSSSFSCLPVIWCLIPIITIHSTTQTMSDHQASSSSVGEKRRKGLGSSSITERPLKRRGIAPGKSKQDVYHLKRDDIPEDAGQFKVCCSFMFSL